MATRWQRVAIDIPRAYGPQERLAIGQDIIDFIRTRTDRGVDKNGERFAKYSKAYLKSADFRIAGKSAGAVNLQLSGDMLGALEVLSQKPGRVVVGYRNGTADNGKADGNIRGTYGTPTPIPGKARDFLGIRRGDLKDEVLSRYPLADRAASRERAQVVTEASEEAGAFEADSE